MSESLIDQISKEMRREPNVYQNKINTSINKSNGKST
jgi:hypothetical protein